MGAVVQRIIGLATCAALGIIRAVATADLKSSLARFIAFACAFLGDAACTGGGRKFAGSLWRKETRMNGPRTRMPFLVS
ncbi:MAG: hypothetical protein ABI680_04295 [Chthoniobacteraceae bacterium]